MSSQSILASSRKVLESLRCIPPIRSPSFLFLFFSGGRGRGVSSTDPLPPPPFFCALLVAPCLRIYPMEFLRDPKCSLVRGGALAQKQQPERRRSPTSSVSPYPPSIFSFFINFIFFWGEGAGVCLPHTPSPSPFFLRPLGGPLSAYLSHGVPARSEV